MAVDRAVTDRQLAVLASYSDSDPEHEALRVHVDGTVPDADWLAQVNAGPTGAIVFDGVRSS